MYSWSYIKAVTLAKLDLEEAEAQTMGYINKFVYFANEAMTQICSSVKPKHSYYEITIGSEDVGKLKTLDDDNFISFGDDVSTLSYVVNGELITEHCTDEFLTYKGYNQFVCKREGVYHISYNARWHVFGNLTQSESTEKIPVPMDIMDCIPSYIASQCFKIDDEYKSSVYRNEYEMFLARLDDTDYNNTKTIEIAGGW